MGECVTTAKSGLYGFVVVVRYVAGDEPEFIRLARVMKWNARLEVEVVSWCGAGSLGTRWSMASAGQATGSFSFAFDTEINQHVRIAEGSSFGLWLLAGAQSWLVIPSGLIGGLEFDVDIETGALVGGRADFQSSGPYFDFGHVESTFGSQGFLRRTPLGTFGDADDERFLELAETVGQLPTPPASPE